MRSLSCNSKRPVRRAMLGMSLIELMIAITLGMMILAGVIGIFSATSASRSELERTSRQIENGRYAIELLADDLKLAGFYGELNVGSPILTPAAELADPCSTTVDDWKKTLRVHVQGWDQGAAAPSCITTLKSNTDVVAVRRVRGCTAGTSGCAAATSSGAYLQVAQCATESGTAATMYNLGVGTPGTPLHLKDCTTVAPLREYLARTYFISTDNGAGQNIPTLKRKELTGSSGSLSITETPLVEGIEFLHLVYGIDDTGDGMPDGYGADPNTYTRAGCTTCSALNNWMNVVTVQVYLLARNIDTSPGYTDTKTYNLGIDASGNAVSVGPFNDAYRRHVYSSVIRIANPAGRRDTP